MTVDPVLYIAGDIHADGSDTPFVAWLRHLLQRRPATLVILGDLFEYWTETTYSVQRHRVMLQALAALSDQGWQVVVVGGNREFMAGRYLESASKTRIYWPSFEFQLGPRCVRIVHGDRLCYDPGYHAYAAWMRGFWMQAMNQLVPALVHDVVARWMRRRSQQRQQAVTGKPKSRIFIDPRRVAAAGRGVDSVVAGHIHQVWRRQVRGVDLWLVGDWPGRHGRWIEGFADGSLVARAELFS